MKVAYADPPYVGQARKHYSADPRCAEVDHSDLVRQMCAEYDCWALSCSSPSLKQILALCPDDVRIGAWVKPFCSFKPGVNPAYAWEPVVLWHGRNLGRHVLTVRDWVSANITLKKKLSGAKPEAFCFWLFDFMGLVPADEFIDLYPGTGIVTRCWKIWREKLDLSIGGA
jgi:hypothetical protein